MNDQPVTDAEITGWLDADRQLLELTRSWRRRYLAASEDDRPAIAREVGLRNLTAFNDRIANLRRNIASYERQLDQRSSR